MSVRVVPLNSLPYRVVPTKRILSWGLGDVRSREETPFQDTPWTHPWGLGSRVPRSTVLKGHPRLEPPCYRQIYDDVCVGRISEAHPP